MIINKNSWHYKWFMLWVTNKYTESGKYPRGKETKDSYLISRECGTLTLCTYVKAILIYAPISYIWANKISRLIMINISLLLIIWAELVFTAFNDTMSIITAVIIFLSILASLLVFSALYGEQIRDNIKIRLGHTSEKIENASFLIVLKNYYKAKKEKICPFIKFEE